MPETATVNNPAFAWALAWEKVCRSRRQPPTSIAAPATSSKLPMIDPTSDALATSFNPRVRATMPIINSAAFPNVALSNPPQSDPVLTARCSVACPISRASGMMDAPAKIKVAVGSQCRCPPAESRPIQ